jgi:hypothetical protein
VLETPDGPLRESPVEVALAAHNTDFIAGPTVTQILNHWWFKPDALTLNRRWPLLVYSVFRMPLTKFLVDVFCFLLFFYLIARVALQAAPVDAPLTTTEYFYWTFVFGRAMGEIVQVSGSSSFAAVGGATALLTFICVLSTLRTQVSF